MTDEDVAVGESYPGVLTTVFWPLMPFSRGYVHINSSDVRPGSQPSQEI